MEKRYSGTPRAAIYARISSDREGDAEGVGNQIEDCKELATREGYEWSDDDLFVDNDTGASTLTRAKHRPEYEAMLTAVRAGKYEAIIAYSNSRLTRRMREFEDLIDLHKSTGVKFHTKVSGNFDLGTADGRRMARFLAGEAAGEAERTGERTAGAKAKQARKGLFLGGRTPYGWDYDKQTHRLTVNDTEAARVREATNAVLAGRSLNGIAKEWNAAGVMTRTGKTWDATSVRDLLARPRNAGLMSTGRATRGDLNLIEVREEHRENCPPLVDEDSWRALYAFLMDPSRRTNRNTVQRWLGTNVYVCGKCGALMKPASVKRRSTAKGADPEDRWPKDPRAGYYYRCQESAHLGIRADHVDQLVKEYVTELVRDPRVVALMTKKDPNLAADRERRTTLSQRLENVLNDYADGVLNRDQFAKASQRIQAQLDEVQARMDKAVTRSVSLPIAGAVDPGQAFLEAPIDVQRAVVAGVVRVVILPRVTRSTKWSPERVEITLVGDRANGGWRS